MKAKANTSSRLLKYSAIVGSATLAGVSSGAITVFDNGGSGWTVNFNQYLSININGAVSGRTLNRDMSLYNRANIPSSHYRALFALYANSMVRTRLSAGQPISSANVNEGFFMAMTNYSSGQNGWTAPGTGYIGLKFDDGVTVNYGWAEITLSTPGASQTIVLNRFAVEGVPDLAILAGATPAVIPETSSLVLAALALGAVGVFSLRNRKS